MSSPHPVTGTVARLLADRWMAAVLASVGVVQIGLTMAHVGGMPCPFLAVTGRPCPGCGLSRATAAICRGDWGAAWRLHAFAPVVLFAIAMLGAAATLPAAARDRVVRLVDLAERKWRVTQVLLAFLVLYWIARVGYAPVQVAQVASPGF